MWRSPDLRSEAHLDKRHTQASAIFSHVFPQREDSTSEKIAWSSFSHGVMAGEGGRGQIDGSISSRMFGGAKAPGRALK